MFGNPVKTVRKGDGEHFLPEIEFDDGDEGEMGPEDGEWESTPTLSPPRCHP